MKNEYETQLREKRFQVRGTLIIDTVTGKMAVSVSRTRKDPEERLPGESWLDMWKRTESDRDAIDRETEERAIALCAFMNSQN